eukprot:131271-Prorocentrum_minimum.AAC.2
MVWNLRRDNDKAAKRTLTALLRKVLLYRASSYLTAQSIKHTHIRLQTFPRGKIKRFPRSAYNSVGLKATERHFWDPVLDPILELVGLFSGKGFEHLTRRSELRQQVTLDRRFNGENAYTEAPKHCFALLAFIHLMSVCTLPIAASVTKPRH